MVAGSCPFMGLYLDMEQGTVTPRYVTPEAVARIVGPDSEWESIGLGNNANGHAFRSKEREEKP